MSDPRHALQATFQPAKRWNQYGNALVRLDIKGFRNHKSTVIDIDSPITALCGVNGSGKSTVLQLAGSAYKAPSTANRYYVSSFILAGRLDQKPFTDDATVEFTYVLPPVSDKNPTRTLTLSRSGSFWSGYENQPERRVAYFGIGFHLPHAELDESSKTKFQDHGLRLRYKQKLDDTILEKISAILLCRYDSAHENTLRKNYARTSMALLSAKRCNGIEYSEANMGSGEARLYQLVKRIEELPPQSLVLIEEPETALHPSAQFEVGKYFMDAAMRKGHQFLITTHSEFVMLAFPQKSRIYLKREADSVTAIQGVGVRQAMSLMDNLAIPSLYVLVEDDVAEAIVTELLRQHDPDFLKTVRILVAGDKSKIQTFLSILQDQNLPVCAVRDGDFGAEKKIRMYKLFGDKPPEKEVFASTSFKTTFSKLVDLEAIEIANRGRDHHEWFDELIKQMACKRSEVLAQAARAYLAGISSGMQKGLIEEIKASAP